jgi:FkbM family methyltransferase
LTVIASSTFDLRLADGVQIRVPDTLNQITPYVLLEQGDWFEQDIGFVRSVLRAGWQVVDIGANHGVYALSMAQAVGREGRVWAFEPGSAVRELLQASLALNSFSHVHLLAQAVSDREGIARLSNNVNTELNRLDADSSGPAEEVAVTSLDSAMAAQGWPDVAFIKMDAEGEESNILRGGRRFLLERSPLVMFEIRSETGLQLGLVEMFEELGYRSYRLVAELGLLVPFHAQDPLDPYVLNLYACKSDRARQLMLSGHLLEEDHPEGRSALEADSEHWQTYLARWPYAQPLLAGWLAAEQLPGWNELLGGLALFAQAQQATAPPAQRWAALSESLVQLQAACRLNSTTLRELSLARVAAACGERMTAVRSLTVALQAWNQRPSFSPSEPFLAPVARFERIPPGPDLFDWVMAAALEGHERLSSYSSFYSSAANQQRLKLIQSLGFGDDEMRRRLWLMQERQAATAPQR